MKEYPPEDDHLIPGPDVRGKPVSEEEIDRRFAALFDQGTHRNQVKVGIWKDESPYYRTAPKFVRRLSDTQPADYELEVTPQTAARWKSVNEQWQLIQAEIIAAIALSADGVKSDEQSEFGSSPLPPPF